MTRRPRATSRRPRRTGSGRPATDHVGQVVDAEPDPRQPDQQYQQDPSGERPPPRPGREQGPGQDQPHGDQRGDPRGVATREAQRLVSRTPLGEVGTDPAEVLLEQGRQRGHEDDGGHQPGRRPRQPVPEQHDGDRQEEEQAHPGQARRGEHREQPVQGSGPVVADVQGLADRRVQILLGIEVRADPGPEQRQHHQADDRADQRGRHRAERTPPGECRAVRGNVHDSTLPDAGSRDTLTG